MFLDEADLEAGLAHVEASPRGCGTVEMIVARPGVDERVVLDVGEFNEREGLVGDDWLRRATARGAMKSTPEPPDERGMVTLMNVRYLDLISRGDKQRWPLAGDQLLVDLDLSDDHLAPGDRLAAGSAVFEVTDKAHTGCRKFVARYGEQAMRFANSDVGRRHHLRGIYVRVVQPGQVRPGDQITRMSGGLDG